MPKRQQEATTILVEPVRSEAITAVLRGTSPIILNRMSEKAMRELLLPKGRKTAADRQASLKHAPLHEYRASAYTLPEGDALLAISASAVKASMMTAALDLPGTKKAQIGRLVYVHGDYLPVYGVPRLFMSVVRSAGIDRTPDVRTRAILSEWVVVATISYVVPLLNASSMFNLLAAAGITAGLGDWRPEKGKGNFGQFVVANVDDADVQATMATGGREAQQYALDNPVCYDEDTQRLLDWYTTEVERRGR